MTLHHRQSFLKKRKLSLTDILTVLWDRASNKYVERMVASTIKEDRMYDFPLARFRDGKTLQAIGDEVGLSRERVRQLLDKYVKQLRNPDILRFLNCRIKDIPEKSSHAMVERLESHYKEK